MDRIGEYLVQRMVGEGGMGKVYEAEERLSKRKVALKVLRPELTRSEEGRRLFLNEMQILAHLEHPHIVRSLASMEVDGQLVMVLEFLQGRTLREELTDRRTLRWHEAVELTSDIAEALEAAHSQAPPIIHRDLKPENVMLTATGLKVMDFGIAKVLAAAQATNTQSIGTLQYMSPEQIDARTIDPRSDLYSLGLLFYEALTGHPPFHSASPRELLNMQCTAEPPDLSDAVRRTMPRGIEDLLFALLEKLPADRPTDASAVIAALAPFRAADPSPRRSRAARGDESKGATAAAAEAGGEVPHEQAHRTQAGDAPPETVPDGDEESGAEVANDGARSPRPASQDGNTLHSTPHRADPNASKTDETNKRKRRARGTPEGTPRLDTIALVEQARDGRELSTGKAVLLIAGLSLFAGVATYMVRTHARGVGEPAQAATASASRVSSPGAR